jgi:type IV fimbrial biogenesis protein FimT
MGCGFLSAVPVQCPKISSSNQGFTLVEILLTLSLCALLLPMLVLPLQSLIGVSRLEASLQNLVSVLNFARSEALRSGRAVNLCGIFMRRNNTLNSCRKATAEKPLPWAQGILVFYDRPGGMEASYDTQEDLRDVVFHFSSVRVVATRDLYRLLPRGDFAAGMAPSFTLTERFSGRCATVNFIPSSAWPEVCRGAACPGCAA